MSLARGKEDGKRMITLSLPYPPTVNHYWRHIVIGRSVRAVISAQGRQYKAVCSAMARRQWAGRETLACPLAVEITFYPPDRRKRDLDNLPKLEDQGLLW